jgi:hydrogenase nickel incorporation protein HypA/HybF
MHEIRIAQDMQKIILQVASKENLNKVTAVNVQFGEMVQIVPDIFRFAFEEVSRNSPVEGSELNFEIIPVKIKCINCLKEYEISREGRFECMNCGSVDIEIIHGKELLIKSIEGE